MTPEGRQSTMRLAGERWDRMTLMLDDSTFTLSASQRGLGYSLPMSGHDVKDAGGVTEKLGWDHDKPKVERSIKGGGSITDTFELIAPDRLQVTRSVSAGGPARAVHFVYGRQPATGK